MKATLRKHIASTSFVLLLLAATDLHASSATTRLTNTLKGFPFSSTPLDLVQKNMIRLIHLDPDRGAKYFRIGLKRVSPAGLNYELLMRKAGRTVLHSDLSPERRQFVASRMYTILVNFGPGLTF